MNYTKNKLWLNYELHEDDIMINPTGKMAIPSSVRVEIRASLNDHLTFWDNPLIDSPWGNEIWLYLFKIVFLFIYFFKVNFSTT